MPAWFTPEKMVYGLIIFLSERSNSPYVASILGNLRHWLEDDPQVVALIEKLPMIQREALCKKENKNVFK